MATKELKVQCLTLYVTDEHTYHKGEFIFHCRELNLSEVTLTATQIAPAVIEACQKVEKFLVDKTDAMRNIRYKASEFVDACFPRP
jgi:hypothetical protein